MLSKQCSASSVDSYSFHASLERQVLRTDPPGWFHTQSLPSSRS